MKKKLLCVFLVPLLVSAMQDRREEVQRRIEAPLFNKCVYHLWSKVVDYALVPISPILCVGFSPCRENSDGQHRCTMLVGEESCDFWV